MKVKKLLCLLLAGTMLATVGCGQTPSGGDSSGEGRTQSGSGTLSEGESSESDNDMAKREKQHGNAN